MPSDLHTLSLAVDPSPGYQPPRRFERLFNYQRAALEQSPLRQHMLLAHAPGLGKTPMALATGGDEPVVVCPPTIARQWAAKLLEWTGLTAEVLTRGKDVEDIARYRRGPVVVSDSLVHLIPPQLETRRLIVDEVHRFKSLDTRRTVYLFGGTYRATKITGLAQRAEKVIALTGTPLVNSPVDLFPFLRRCAPSIAPSFKAYTERYCPPVMMKVPGSPFPKARYDLKVQNLDELARKLRESVMIRPPADVCRGQMPELIEDEYRLDIDDPAGRSISEEDLVAVFDGQAMDEAEKIAIATARRDTGLAKANSAVLQAWLGELIDEGERPLLWCWHQEVANILGHKLELPVIHGGVPMDRRAQIVLDYQAQAVKGICITIGAAGTGLDGLQASGSLAVFIEQDYVPSNNEQAVARLHRVGQTRAVRDVRVRTSAVVDRAIERILRRKIAMTKEALR